jgi:hypothetical protein
VDANVMLANVRLHIAPSRSLNLGCRSPRSAIDVATDPPNSRLQRVNAPSRPAWSNRP